MVLQILINVECVQFLRIKARQEHSHDEQEVDGLHPGLALLHSLVNVIIVSAEIVRSERSTEVSIVVIHNGLQLIRLYGIGFKALIHAGLGVVLTDIGRVGKDGGNFDVRLQVLKDLVVFEQHRDRLHSKEGIEFTIEGGFSEVIQDE